MVNNIFAGEYHSAFKGQGMTFSEFREYVLVMMVRAIAWSLTARTGKTYIKKYDEERENTLLLAVDVSGSEDFGTKGYFKGEVITHLAALLSFSAVKNKDPVGLLLVFRSGGTLRAAKKGAGSNSPHFTGSLLFQAEIPGPRRSLRPLSFCKAF
jgi:uncharacterized protein (DUF58 family)